MKFKVGDRVKFVKSIYGHTSDVKIGEIYKIRKVDTTDIPYQIENLEWFMEEELEPVEYTYEDLKKCPIGTKITFEDGKFNIRKNEEWFTGECPREIADLRSLKDNYGKRGKIIKIEEPIYQTVYEYKPETLDKVEKRYLRGVIRPFRDKVKTIKKQQEIRDNEEDKSFIDISVDDDADIMLPYFDTDMMYKGMKTNKKYTLEELGL